MVTARVLILQTLLPPPLLSMVVCGANPHLPSGPAHPVWLLTTGTITTN